MGFCYRYVNIERNGEQVSHYALLDMGSELSAVSEDVASKVNLQMKENINVRGSNGGARGWVAADTVISFVGGDTKLNASIVVVPKRITGEDVIIGRDVLQHIPNETLISLRYICDSCRRTISLCRCSKKRVQKLG
jgi:hypothetical protein